MKTATETDDRGLWVRLKEQGETWLHRIEMRPFLTLRYLAEAVADPRHVHFANVAGL